MEIYGTSNKILEVDLGKRSFSSYQVLEDERSSYLGAKGLGLKLLYDRLPVGADPLGEANIFAVLPGVIMGTGAPCSARFHALAKSPLTGIMTSSSCGGPFGMMLKTAGWDGLLLKGLSAEPVVLEINKEGVNFVPAGGLWGKSTSQAQAELSGKDRGILVIGPAGENLVRFANIRSGDRFLGRGGLGAVLGSKRVKAIVAQGREYKIVPKNPELFEKVKKRATAYLKRNMITGNLYRNYGTPTNVNLNNAAGILPVRNFQSGRHDLAYQISGEEIHDLHLIKHHTCKACTILCGHKGTFASKVQPVPEYETLSLMGSNLGVFDPDQIAQWNELCGELGLDTISTGGTLAWAMEAGEKGLLQTGLGFGQTEKVGEILEDIAYARGLGKDLGQGSRYLSKKYGGEEFAIQVKGLEVAGYDPRGCFGHGLAYAVANRGGCHLSAAIFALECYFGLLSPFAVRAKAKFVRFFESLTAGVNSLQTCQFTMFAYTLEPPLSKLTPDSMLKLMMQNLPDLAIPLVDFSLYPKLWSAVTGYDLSSRDFLRSGDRIVTLERYMNTREGISRKDDTLPRRFLYEGLESDPQQRTVPLDRMLEDYYRVRGYDREGRPTPETLDSLGIEPRTACS